MRTVGVATEVTVAGGKAEDYAGIATQLLAHVNKAGALKTAPDGSPKVGMFSPAVVKAARPYFDAVRVNRRPAVTADQLSTFLAFTEAERQLTCWIGHGRRTSSSPRKTPSANVCCGT